MSNDSRILFISDFRYKLGNFSTELPTITSLFPRSCKKSSYHVLDNFLQWAGSRSSYMYIFRQIICWQSHGTTTVTEVKLHYFHGRGSTTVVAVKNQVQLKKLRIAKFIQKWKKKFLLPLLWYYHGHGSNVILLPSPWQYRGSTSR